MFDTHSFCEILRKCRARGITLSQIQILSSLKSKPLSKSEISDLTGISLAGTVKCILYLQDTGDVVILSVRKTRGRPVNIYGLSGQGKRLIRKVATK